MARLKNYMFFPKHPKNKTPEKHIRRRTAKGIREAREMAKEYLEFHGDRYEKIIIAEVVLADTVRKPFKLEE